MKIGGPVVVLGCGGFIGANLTKLLEEEGREVLGFSSSDADLTDSDAVDALFRRVPAGASIVMCATVNRQVDNSFAALSRNICMAENLVEATTACSPAGLIFLSTVDVYGPQPALPLTEGTMPDPSSYYAIGKLASERLLRRPGAVDCPVTVVRLPGVYGPGDRQKSIVGRFLASIAQGAPLVLRGDGSVLRDYVAVEDICRIIGFFAASPCSGVFNLASGTSRPLRDVIAALSHAAGRPATIEHAEADPSAAADLEFDVGALRRAIPGLSFTTLEDGAMRYTEHMGDVAPANGPEPALALQR